MPTSILSGSTLNRGSGWPGSVQPANAIPMLRVMAFARRAAASTLSMSSPRAALAPATLKT